ncbi:MAG: DNA-binding transcriptional LysR family regulator [Candidatus Azotimanducaceae bacterium]|jgi:DNA-binding transcriptional LysR family regulator
MDTSDIDMIQVITEAGSLTKAAEILFVSQPTLSKRLARLESQLSTTLFHRSATGLAPSSVTKYIIKEAQPLKAQLARIERHVQQLTDLQTGVVRIGVGPIIEQVLLPAVLKKFFNRTGNVRISVVTDQADVLLDQFEQAKLDIIAGPFKAGDFDNKDHIAFPLIRDPIIQVARWDHPLFDSGPGP